MNNSKENRFFRLERGNVLFVILIAVVLFAALSYAVTQSSRGGGSADFEVNKIAASRVIQNALSFRADIERWRILNGVSAADMDFCDNSLPATLPDSCSIISALVCSSGSYCVFSSDGGGISMPLPINELNPSSWMIYEVSASRVVTDVGTSSPDVYMTYNIGLNDDVCKDINDGLGLGRVLLTDLDAGVNLTTSPSGLEAGCLSVGAGSANYYFEVLVAN